jgi:hypothetical protein
MVADAKNKMFEWPMMKHLKNNYSLVPIVVVCLFGCALPAFQILRTLAKNPDVHLNKTKNPRPWEKLETPDGKPIQFKYFTTRDYNEFISERPKLD